MPIDQKNSPHPCPLTSILPSYFLHWYHTEPLSNKGNLYTKFYLIRMIISITKIDTPPFTEVLLLSLLNLSSVDS